MTKQGKWATAAVVYVKEDLRAGLYDCNAIETATY